MPNNTLEEVFYPPSGNGWNQLMKRIETERKEEKNSLFVWKWVNLCLVLGMVSLHLSTYLEFNKKGPPLIVKSPKQKTQKLQEKETFSDQVKYFSITMKDDFKN